MYHSTYEYSKNAGKILKPAAPIQPGKLHAHDDPVPLGVVNTGPFTRWVLRNAVWGLSFWCMFKMVRAFDKDETACYFLWFGCMITAQFLYESIKAYQHRHVICPHCAQAELNEAYDQAKKELDL